MTDKETVKARLQELLALDARTKDQKAEVHELQITLHDLRQAEKAQREAEALANA